MLTLALAACGAKGPSRSQASSQTATTTAAQATTTSTTPPATPGGSTTAKGTTTSADACSLVSPAEAASISPTLTVVKRFPPHSTSGRAGAPTLSVSVCAWGSDAAAAASMLGPGEHLLLDVMKVPAGYADLAKSQFEDSSTEGTPVPGIGDEAKLGIANGGSEAVLVFLKGGTLVTLSYKGSESEATGRKDALIALAKKLAARL